MRKETPNEILLAMKNGKKGMRRVLLDDLKDSHVDAPRPLARSISEYMKGATARPVFGIHKAARLAEHYLHRAKYGKESGRRFVADADRLYFEIRQVILNLTRQWNGEDALDKNAKSRLRGDVACFMEKIRDMERLFGTVGRVICPCCNGTGRVFDRNSLPSEITKVLDEAVKAGRLGYSRSCGYFGV